MTKRPARQRDAKAMILDDLRPVAPLAPCGWRGLRLLLPLGLVVAAFVLPIAGLRPDMEAVGILGTWGVSLFFFLVALAGYVLVVRESIPGQRAPFGYWTAGLGLVLVAQLVAGFVIHTHAANPTPAGEALRLAGICSGAIAAVALPSLLGLFLLLSKGFPAVSTAVFAAVVTVVSAEALWRLHCPFTSPAHLLTAHFPAYLIAVAVALVRLRLAGTR